ncbi:2-methylcitrate dehydratase (PrpD), putative [Talaromyces stipitatus ATCC 10500]|uniref:2-methylcitrate dehydratase (PrpD), putative n=1 Tax=Talaromyces stipitatus (strain ATCC 10500 / CBS 375.48 / QM 6759 / NRRL 1006) TaxID=441959 RepID=B8MCM4_TALSN|nr:2-methylcitrate dehydratase (PrpD), putative [Talaromyces stipitatus ATCC 10500]EED18840.1 2-methylcitrate dehydratase (PrpD), putative [Talaromyces stipitatus ATCC 10500]
MASSQFDQVIIDIKDYVFNYRIDSPKAWKNARTALLDAIGCAIETVFKSDDCKRMFGPIVHGSITPNGFRLPGTAYTLDPLKGSFDMGTAIRYLDHNDAIAGADWGHPSDNLGAILAVSDWLCRSSKEEVLVHNGPPLTMKTILEALVKAYEIQGCMLLRNAFNAYGLDHVILVKLASTAVVSWLLGLTEIQTMAAISQVWMDGQALRVYRQRGNTIPRKGWAAGDACMKATQLALLTRAGQPGSPTPLTMPRWGFYASSFGNNRFDLPKKYSSWVIENIIFKVMPVEGHGVPSVEAAMIHSRTLKARQLSAMNDIKKIIIRTNAATDTIINKTGQLANAADRDHCLQYLIALTFLKGDIPEAEDFLDNSIWSSSSDLDNLRAKIEIFVDDRLTKDYMDLDVKSVATGMTIMLSDGTHLSEVLIEFPVGHGKNPRTQDVVQQKFQKNMKLMFSPEEIDEIVSIIEDKENEDKPISEFLDLLVRESSLNSRL